MSDWSNWMSNWFADAMTSFSGVTFILFCFVFVFMIYLQPRPFVQSFFDIQAPRQPHVFLSFFLLFIWRCRFFRVFFVPFPLSLCMERMSYILSFRRMFFYLVTTGWIFYITYVRIKKLKKTTWYIHTNRGCGKREA